jgi:hypothetical protein
MLVISPDDGSSMFLQNVSNTYCKHPNQDQYYVMWNIISYIRIVAMFTGLTADMKQHIHSPVPNVTCPSPGSHLLWSSICKPNVGLVPPPPTCAVTYSTKKSLTNVARISNVCYHVMALVSPLLWRGPQRLDVHTNCHVNAVTGSDVKKGSAHTHTHTHARTHARTHTHTHTHTNTRAWTWSLCV